MSSPSSSSSIHSKERNPVRKIPLIHRILAFATSDVLHAEQLSTTCNDWRESVEVYGSGLFARFAVQEPDEYFRYFYELVEWGQGTWMLEHMIVGWNKLAHVDETIFAADSKIARENRQQFYAANMADEIDDLTLSSFELKKIRNASMSRKPTAEQEEEEQQGNDNEKKSKEITQFRDFFNNEFMDRCIRLYGGTKPCVLAARHNRHDVLRLLYKYGADLEDSFMIPTGETSAIEAASRHRSIHSIVVLCQVKAIREIEEEIYCLLHDMIDTRKPRTARRARIAEAQRAFKEKYPDRSDAFDAERGEDIANITAFTSWDLGAVFDGGSSENVEFLHFLKSLGLVVDDGNLDLNLPWKLKKRLADLKKERGMIREVTVEECDYVDERSEEMRLTADIENVEMFAKTKVPSYYRPTGFTYTQAADVTWPDATDATQATDATWE